MDHDAHRSTLVRCLPHLPTWAPRKWDGRILDSRLEPRAMRQRWSMEPFVKRAACNRSHGRLVGPKAKDRAQSLLALPPPQAEIRWLAHLCQLPDG
jgi:hypothetical protein